MAQEELEIKQGSSEYRQRIKELKFGGLSKNESGFFENKSEFDGRQNGHTHRCQIFIEIFIFDSVPK